MTDVLIDFAKTGERSFKRLIDSMIEGLIRYEMQQQMAQQMDPNNVLILGLNLTDGSQ